MTSPVRSLPWMQCTRMGRFSLCVHSRRARPTWFLDCRSAPSALIAQLGSWLPVGQPRLPSCWSEQTSLADACRPQPL